MWKKLYDIVGLSIFAAAFCGGCVFATYRFEWFSDGSIVSWGASWKDHIAAFGPWCFLLIWTTIRYFAFQSRFRIWHLLLATLVITGNFDTFPGKRENKLV